MALQNFVNAPQLGRPQRNLSMGRPGIQIQAYHQIDF